MSTVWTRRRANRSGPSAPRPKTSASWATAAWSPAGRCAPAFWSRQAWPIAPRGCGPPKVCTSTASMRRRASRSGATIPAVLSARPSTIRPRAITRASSSCGASCRRGRWWRAMKCCSSHRARRARQGSTFARAACGSAVPGAAGPEGAAHGRLLTGSSSTSWACTGTGASTSMPTPSGPGHSRREPEAGGSSFTATILCRSFPLRKTANAGCPAEPSARDASASSSARARSSLATLTTSHWPATRSSSDGTTLSAPRSRTPRSSSGRPRSAAKRAAWPSRMGGSTQRRTRERSPASSRRPRAPLPSPFAARQARARAWGSLRRPHRRTWQ